MHGYSAYLETLRLFAALVHDLSKKDFQSIYIVSNYICLDQAQIYDLPKPKAFEHRKQNATAIQCYVAYFICWLFSTQFVRS